MSHHDNIDPENEFDDPEKLSAEEDIEFDEERDAQPSEAETTEAMIARLEAENATTKDRLLRLAAEMENTKRRAAKEKTDASQYGIVNFARDLLSVSDNFQRALEATPSTDEAVTAETFNSLRDGIKMTQKELLAAFERNGVHIIDPKGEKFDPNIHQAIAEVPGNGVPQGHVVDVAQIGFTIGDRVLRAAMVTVSNGE
ncbi:MAG: nucleotide exchange factor GrpE [bacterium]